MELVHERCCGLDVHKNSITACVIIAEPDRKRIKQARSFRAMTCDLLALVDWLQELGVTHVAMEATDCARKLL